jgi:DNA/RNA-binding domain of Phe-tRNA-synthetase-like protein
MNPIAIRNTIPDQLTLGALTWTGLAVNDARALAAFITGRVAVIRASHSQHLPPGYTATRALYRATRLDPTRHRPSSEALWRRLRDRDDFPLVLPVVDLTNLLALQYQICYGLYDRAALAGPIVAGLGAPGDGYQGIRKDYLDMAGKIVLKDDRGAFGNPSADSLRTAVGSASRDILLVMFFPAGFTPQCDVERATRDVFRRFFTWVGIESETG